MRSSLRTVEDSSSCRLCSAVLVETGANEKKFKFCPTVVASCWSDKVDQYPFVAVATNGGVSRTKGKLAMRLCAESMLPFLAWMMVLTCSVKYRRARGAVSLMASSNVVLTIPGVMIFSPLSLVASRARRSLVIDLALAMLCLAERSLRDS